MGYHHGLLQGGIFAVIAALVIVVGVVTYRVWVARSENRHIDRDSDGARDDGRMEHRSQGVSGGSGSAR
jgi:hypothetical protein